MMALSCTRAVGTGAMRVVGTCDRAGACQSLVWWGKTLPWLKSKLVAFRKGFLPSLTPFSSHLKHGVGPCLWFLGGGYDPEGCCSSPCTAFSMYQPLSDTYLPLVIGFCNRKTVLLPGELSGGSLQEIEAMGASLDCRHAEWGGGRCCPSLRDHKWNTLDWVNCLAKHGEPGMTNTITDNPSSSSQICLYPSAPPCTGLAWRVFHGTDYLQTHKKVNLFQTVESIRLHAVLLVY